MYVSFLTVLGLHCYVGFFLATVSQRCSLVAVCGLLIAVASLAQEQRIQARELQWLGHLGSVGATPRL